MIINIKLLRLNLVKMLIDFLGMVDAWTKKYYFKLFLCSLILSF